MSNERARERKDAYAEDYGPSSPDMPIMIGTIVPANGPPSGLSPELSSVPANDVYAGIGSVAFSETENNILRTPVEDEVVEKRPDGLLYVPGVHCRNRLNKAFGAGAWGLRAINGGIQTIGKTVVYNGALYVRGRFVSEAMGEAKQMASYATAVESAKTDCLTRCCKDLGMFAELWDPAWRRGWEQRSAAKSKAKLAGVPVAKAPENDNALERQLQASVDATCPIGLRGMLKAKQEALGITQDKWVAGLHRRFGKLTSTQLTKAEAQSLLDELNKREVSGDKAS